MRTVLVSFLLLLAFPVNGELRQCGNVWTSGRCVEGTPRAGLSKYSSSHSSAAPKGSLRCVSVPRGIDLRLENVVANQSDGLNNPVTVIRGTLRNFSDQNAPLPIHLEVKSVGNGPKAYFMSDSLGSKTARQFQIFHFEPHAKQYELRILYERSQSCDGMKLTLAGK
jgi:hypothetical protein